jgi:hypothetical protein
MTSFTLIGGEMDEEGAAAALAAVTCLLEEEAAAAALAPDETTRAGWHDAAKLIAQGLIPTRVPATPRWGSIERLRRGGRGGSGIVGQ